MSWGDANVREMVSHLVYPGLRLQELLQLVDRNEVPTSGSQFLYFLQHLARRGILRVTVGDVGQPLATLVPISPTFSMSQGSIPERPVLLSRFAYVRRLHDVVAVESPLSHARLLLHDERAVRLIHRLATPTVLDDPINDSAGLTRETAEQLLQLLSSAGMLTEIGEDETTDEDRWADLKFWQFHDLLFHASSREGRHDGPVGASFLWAGVEEPLPALISQRSESAGCIDLFRPDLAELEQSDLPFARVVESRHSIRDYGETPISAEQLGEFLYRVGRVTERREFEFDVPGGPVNMEFAMRPYPSAGGIYELEIYPLIQSCGDLEAGLYRYDALGHRLERTEATEAARRQLLQRAGAAAGISAEQPQVVLILSARFGRLMWKYSGMAYAVILKDVGVLQQSMYLTATAMGLAPCALGTGNSDIFADAIGSDYYAETSVGEFLLGSIEIDTAEQ